MARNVVSAMLLVVAVIHLLPLSGVLSIARLSALYGLSFDDPNLAIPMRHRAVLFGFRPPLQAIALLAGFVSVLSLLYLAWSVGSYNDQLGRVFTADIFGLVCLAIGAATYAFSTKQS